MPKTVEPKVSEDKVAEDKLAAVRAQLEQAERQIAATLDSEPRSFESAASQREQFNQARERKLSASQRMATLKAREL